VKPKNYNASMIRFNKLPAREYEKRVNNQLKNA